MELDMTYFIQASEKASSESSPFKLSAALWSKSCAGLGECVLMQVSSVAHLVRTWSEMLTHINDNVWHADSMLAQPEHKGGAWPLTHVVITWPRNGSCVNRYGAEISVGLVGGFLPDDGISIVLDGAAYATVPCMTNRCPLRALQEGRHCLTVRHVDVRGIRVTRTHDAEACFVVGRSRTEGESEFESAQQETQNKANINQQRQAGIRDGCTEGGAECECSTKAVAAYANECVGGDEDGERERISMAKKTILMVTWMPPVHHVTGMSERLWQVGHNLMDVLVNTAVHAYMCICICCVYCACVHACVCVYYDILCSS
jgi:hypothetical protein